MIMTTGADVAMAAVILGTISGTIITVVKTFAARGATRDAERLSSAGETDVRLHRMEQAIDAIAVEVQRLSDSQHDSARLLADHRPAPEKSISPTHTS